MRRLSPVPVGGDVVILAAQTAQAHPPLLAGTNFGAVPSSWGNTNYDVGTVSQFDLEIFAADAVNLTSTTLYSMTLHTGTVAADDIDTVTHTTEKLTVTGHAYLTGDGPFQLTTTGTLPTGYSLLTDYYIIVFDANTIGLATSVDNALAGTLVAISSAGTGTHTITAESDCKLARWSIASAISGTVALTLRKGYINRFNHDPAVLGYALSATFSTTVAVTAVVRPIVEK